MGNTPVEHLTKEQKEQGVEMRRNKINYDVIAKTLGVDAALVRYRLLQHIRLTHPELLGRKTKTISRVVNGMNDEDIVHYKHNPPLKIVDNKASQVTVRIDKEEVARRLAELGLTERKTEDKKTVFTLNGVMIGNKQGKTVFEATFGGGQY